MNIAFKKYKRTSTYHRKLKLATDKYLLMYNKMYTELNAPRISAPVPVASDLPEGNFVS